jgi:hypothetical protein
MSPIGLKATVIAPQPNVRIQGQSDIDTPAHSTTIPPWDSTAAKWRIGAARRLFGAGPAECSLRAAPDRYCCDAVPENPVPGEPIIRLLPYVSTLPLATAEIAPAALSKIDVLLTSTAASAPLA